MDWLFLFDFVKFVGVVAVLFLIFRLSVSKLSTSKHSINDLPGLKTYPLLGDLPILWEEFPNGYTKNIRLQQAAFGLHHLFPDASVVKLLVSFIPYVFIVKADAAEVILSSNKEITKSREYTWFKSWLGLGLLTSTGAKWKKRRRMLTPSFHFRVLTEFQKVINDHSLAFVGHLSKLVDKEFIDMQHFVTMCTLDIICETAMGVNIDAQNNSDSPYVHSLHHMSKIGVERISNLLHWNDFIFSLCPAGRLYNASLKIVHGFTKKIIKSRIKEISSKSPENKAGEVGASEDIIVKKRLAFLDLLVDEHFKNPSFTESDIQEEVDTFMFEGHDTTAVGLSWCIYLLGLHPEIQERAYDEVIRVLGQDKQVRVTENELKELKYLECVIKESQRMFPSVPFIGRTLEDDLPICGKVIPKGTNCLVAISVIHRNPDFYPEPDKFDPDRFTIENSSGRHPYGYIPFSAGPRNCIGQKFALNEEKTVMAHLIRNFTWKSLDQLDKLTFTPDMVSRPVPGHRIKLFKRD